MKNRKIKLAFFDLDYTLCESIFPDKDGNLTYGLHREDWIEYCRTHQAGAYDTCRIVPIVYYYAKELQRKGVELFVLGAIYDEVEILPKTVFVRREYRDLFKDNEHILFVKGYDKAKVDKMKEIAKSRNLGIENCELIEDNYTAVLAAIDEGAKGTHVASLFNNYYKDMGYFY